MTSFQFRFISPFTYTPNRPKSCTQTCNRATDEQHKVFPLWSQRKKQDRFAHHFKVANRSFSVVETLSGGSSKRIHARAAGGMIMPPKGSTQRGAPLGDSLVTFSSGRKSPGARGWKPRQGEECRGRGAAPPRIGGCRHYVLA